MRAIDKVQAYVVLVTAVAVAAAVAVFAVAPATNPSFVPAALWLSSLGILAHVLVYNLPVGGAGSIGFIPFLATALVTPNWIAVTAVTGAVVVTEYIGKRGTMKQVFNVAQMSLATSLGILAFLAGGGRSLLEFRGHALSASTAEVLLPFALLVITYFAVNTFAVSGAIAISQDRRILQVWKQNTVSTLSYDVLASPVVYLLAWVYVQYGAVGAIALSIPTLGVRQLYKTNFQLEKVNQELLELMVKAIEARDPYTSGHSRRVAHYSRIIARGIGLSAREVDRIGVAALLHDVGKIHEVFAPILRKPDKLTADEWAIMQTHPIKSAELISTVSNLRDLIAPLRHHHENWDGTGYPDGLKGEQIPLASRIIIFADTIDAMTTDRPYRKAMGETEVRAELIRFRGKQFDPTICDQLLRSPMFRLLFAPAAKEPTPVRSPAVTPASKPRIAVGA
jgi:HD-GYP domain-containing protein (c-di-GMP phosphodiesterase class II)